MFAPAFAPFANAEAIVNSKLALAMLDAGWDVDIVSRNLVGVSSYDYGSTWVEPWVRLREHTFELVDRNVSLLLRKLSSAISAIRLGHAVEGCQWAARAYDLALKLHSQKPYDVILSRAFPDYAHLPALVMTRKTKVPWIANWNDPWSFIYETGKGHELSFIHRRLIRAIAKKSSWITFPSDLLRNAMIKILGRDATHKSSTIPHVAINHKFAVTNNKTDNKAVFEICYAGRLWASQHPGPFLEAFKKLSANSEEAEMRFVFMGLDDVGLQREAARLGIAERVVNLGRLSYAETIARTAKCDLLLVIDPPCTNGMLLTSKFVDYLQANRPIMVISKKLGTLDRIIQHYGGGKVTDSSSVEDVYSTLLNFYNDWENDALNDKYNTDQLYKHFEPDRVIYEYEKIFDALCR
jgi:glycosyltransferase involved in cell wall biosynthesis